MIVDDDNGECTEKSKESCVWICGIMFLFRIDKKTKKKKKVEATQVKAFLEEFALIFEKPKNLSPVRRFDHKIPLKLKA
jgi:hypothetical protein